MDADDPPDAAALATRLLADDEAPDPGGVGEAARALAWALKDGCYGAWSTNPALATRAAGHLARLRDRLPPDDPVTREVAALAAWIQGIAEVTHGRMTAAIEGFDRASAGFQALGRPDHAARTQVPKIMALSMLGQHEAAAACARDTQARLLGVGDVAAASRVSLNLGGLHLRRDEYPEAVRHYREAAVLFARSGDPEHSVIADIGIGDALTSMGDFDEAMRVYARARMRAARHGYPVLEAKIDDSVALLELARGHYAQALSGFERARRAFESLGLAQHLAIAEKQLADAYLELRLLPEALSLYEGLLARFDALDMPDDQAWTLAQQGRALALSGQTSVAAQRFERAAALFTAQGSDVGAAGVALARAELALHAHDLSLAATQAEQAARGFRAAHLNDGAVRAAAVGAQAVLAAGDPDEAVRRFADTLAQAQALQLLSVQGQCLSGSGLAHLALGRSEAATRDFEAAIALFEAQRRVLPDDEIRSAFLVDRIRPYRELLALALAEHRRRPDALAATAVLSRLEQFRARSLAERLGEAPIGAESVGTRALRARLNWLYRRVQRLQDEGDPATRLSEELRRTERELLERSRRDRLERGGASQGLAEPHERVSTPAGAWEPDALRRALGPGQALVAYGVNEDELFACVVSAAGVQVVRDMAVWSEVLEAVRAARFQIESLRAGVSVQRHLATLTTRAEVRLGALHRQLWAPLASALGPARQVIVVGHPGLGSVPFAALHDGEGPLGARVTLAFAPSAQLAHRGLSRPAIVPSRALALGESGRLAHAAEEARVVAAQFGAAECLVGDRATTGALLEAAGRADLLHLACHAHFRGDSPRFSALELRDGPLTAERIEQLSLRPGLVVLSACETAVADETRDEMLGLARAFLVAGASRVLASLWSVDDAVTLAFMRAFYPALVAGAEPGEALRQAQQAIRREHPHPFHWAAFALVGGW